MKNPLTLAGIEPESFRFVAEHLNHCATDGTGFNHAYNYMLCVVVIIVIIIIICNIIIIAEKADDKTSSAHVTLWRVRAMLLPPVIQTNLYHFSGRGRLYGTFM